MRLRTLLAVSLVLALLGGAVLTYFYPFSTVPEKTPASGSLLQKINDEHRVQVLLLNKNDSGLGGSYLMSYEPISNRFSAVYIPAGVKMMSPSYGEVLSFKQLYSDFGSNQLRLEFATILDLDIPYWIEASPGDLSRFVDLLGGVNIEFPVRRRRDRADSVPLKKTYWMDGSLARQYVETAFRNHGAQGRRFRHKTFFLGLIRALKNHSSLIESEATLRRFHSQISTNMSREDLRTALQVLSQLQPDHVKFPGSARVNTPGEASLLDRKEIENMLPKPLKKIIEQKEPQEVIQVQVLNGAGIPQLADKLRDHLQPHPDIDVVEVGNANRYDYETTRIIDRSNNPQSADRIRSILGTGQIESKPSKRLLVDVTIIAGRDLKELIYQEPR